MSNPKITALKRELEEVRKLNKGFITPEKVLEYAKNKNTVLHSRFCWDDTEAANNYRLQQAASIIRSVKVSIIQNNDPDQVIRIREYVSLPEDRGTKGYREVNSVFTQDDLRLQYIESVQAEFESMKKKLKNISTVAFQRAESVSQAIEAERKKAVTKARTSRAAI